VDLTGKVAFVTGGSGDVGGAIAKALAVSGVEVAVSYVGDADRANATVNGSTAEELEH
jgi:3-oxoacyl-[acyl-carrier protein] reductase